jgi:hypothetical protein
MSLLMILWTIFLHPPPATAFLRLKLQTWFPYDSAYWIKAASKCEAELTAYLINNRTEACLTPCACAADCILNDIPGTLQSNYASAQVILGLIPAVLLMFGPSIVEVAVISTRRPLLALLIALGCPTSDLGKMFRRADIREPLNTADRSLFETRLGSYFTSETTESRHDQAKGHAVDLAMYALVLLAIANGVKISVYTDLRTISGWRCGAVFMPMLWFLLSIVEHGWGMIAARVQLWPVRPRAVTQTKTEPANLRGAHFGFTHLVSQPQETPQANLRLCNTLWPPVRLASLIVSDLYVQLPKTQPTVWSECIFWVAQACAFVHMVFGILDLSSLVFIRATESVQVFAQFALSIVLCQMVVQTQIAIMRAELAHRGGQALAADNGVSASAIAMVEGQASQGASREQMISSSVSESIRSQRSAGSRHSVQIVGY